jgi:inosine-uridine nucleoside N-ribohydrolase
VVLDTDAYNEIDDQFAIAYLLRSDDKCNIKAIYAAPFFNNKSQSPEDGMERSYDEIMKILKLAGSEELSKVTYKGSRTYLPDEKTPVESEAARHLAKLADEYSPENPLYVVAIGAITNVASAMLINPSMAEKTVVVWLGGHTLEIGDKEFNMRQDIAAARVVFMSGVPLVQLPCRGVVSAFTLSGPEVREYLLGKNPLADFLAKNTIEEAESYAKGKAWTRVIWDVTAVAWLLNEKDRFMLSRVINTHIPNYDNQYNIANSNSYMNYVYFIKRDELMTDLINKLLK